MCCEIRECSPIVTTILAISIFYCDGYDTSKIINGENLLVYLLHARNHINLADLISCQYIHIGPVTQKRTLERLLASQTRKEQRL
jgi:hypothetical protein